MKLSEAIRLGAMMGPQIFGRYIDANSTCALGAAIIALGEKAESFVFEEDLIWPWITTMGTCPECELDMTFGEIIVCLNDKHCWTREQIADWVATIEPAEVHASETIREVQYGQVPMRSTPEVETFETITI